MAAELSTTGFSLPATAAKWKFRRICNTVAWREPIRRLFLAARLDRQLLFIGEVVEDINALTEAIIGCAIRVHQVLGPGLLERSYEAAMAIELRHSGLAYEPQATVPVSYKDEWVGDYRIDLIVEAAVIVEIKSVERGNPLSEAQMLAYLRASGKHVGLLINFNSHLVTQGIRRFIV